ncbi:metallophosphoesterase family protein [Cellulophaga fucicola]|uniref:Serine/threonine protein phosphatase 1 n=1 Tax=Cellulophaga fucicola TaxID=76595 RepID=A0A1K1Q1G0_9FLAO|nr:metallophosphoesterase family protein [Cellulophaga fucicola]SFW53523.1 serine/threonine protein phosphatase 1 [Cellulophaga fucicola]
MRTLVIGDIHSGLQALEQLLQVADVTKGDHLIFLGDYVDGWSEAVGTVNFLIELKKTHNCTFIRGNHDELCLNWLKTNEHNDTWVLHGGESTKKSYADVDNATKRRHMDFLENLENYYLDANDRLFLHAGFTNLKGVDHEYFKKTFYWDRTLWELALAVDRTLTEDDNKYPQRLLRYKEIYIGHTPVTRIGKTEPHNAANVFNIDTGAAFKGPLSMLDVETKQVWQSDPVASFYPSERGRN